MNWTLEDVEAYQRRLQQFREKTVIKTIQAGFPASALPGELVEAMDGPEHTALEHDLQSKCEDYCDKHGYLWLHDRSRKVNIPGRFLDLIVALPGARVIWCELKRKGNKLSDEQIRTKVRLLFLGHEVYEIRSFRQFVRIVENPPLRKRTIIDAILEE